MTGKCYINFNVIFEMGVNGASGAGFLEALASSSYELASMSLKDNNVTLIRYGKIKCFSNPFGTFLLCTLFSGCNGPNILWCNIPFIYLVPKRCSLWYSCGERLIFFSLASVVPYSDHSWMVVFQSHNTGYRGTRLCTYMVLKFYVVLPIYFPGNPSFSHYASSGSPSTTASADSQSPSMPNLSCYHHFLETHVPGLCTSSSQRSRIGRVAIYCAIVFCLLKTYASTS